MSKTKVQNARSNNLINETSPYLLQHAYNPVDWYPWGTEALAKAKAEDKPIFISIGYSTCYWCHVMEKESFEDSEVAKILNEHYIAIKVDREERPDLDEQYMIATQLLTQRGGWPNSVWLTPDGRPWMAGTYFPRQQFMRILNNAAKFWKTRRDEVEAQADWLASAIKRIGSGKNIPPSRDLDQELIDRAVSELQNSFDEINGGFGSAPKFPPHSQLSLLIHEFRRGGAPALYEMITDTLDAMATGGVRDHVGGGFHRYSTDKHWLVPHFEKMLYDNAQLIRLYTDGFLLTGKQEYRQVVDEIVSWVTREMTDPGGGFHSALDAGPVGREGDFYVWSYGEIIDVLGKSDGESFAEIYGCRKGGNFQEEASGKPTGKNILHFPKSFPKSPGKEMLDKMLKARNRREPPHKDDKIITSWNGLMISSLAYAGKKLNEPSYIQAAADAARFITENMITADGKLLRSYRAQQAGQGGYLEDYAFLADGLLELYAADGDEHWVRQAGKLADIILEDFQDDSDGGFFFVADDHEEILLRSKNILGGGNLPSANAVTAMVLLRLGQTTGRQNYTLAAQRGLTAFSGFMWESPHGSETLVLAAAQSLALAPTPQKIEKLTAAQPDAQQVQPPVTIELFASALTPQPGQTFYAAVGLQIDEGFHIYGPNPDVKFVTPAAISLKQNPQVTAGDIVTPDVKLITDPVLEKPVEVYEGRVWFVIPLAVGEDAAPGPATLVFNIKSQACDAKRCLEPKTASLQLPITIDPQTSEAPNRHKALFDSLNVR